MSTGFVGDLLQELQARDRIVRLTQLYGQLLDDLRLEEWSELFTQDAMWRIPGTDFQGRAAIREGVGAMEPSRPGLVKHVSLPPVIDFESSTRARAWTDQFALSAADGKWIVAAAGRYHDVVVASGERWRFERREGNLSWPPGSTGLDDVLPSPAF